MRHLHHLYIDKQMRDHGLFQAICRVNRLDGDDNTATSSTTRICSSVSKARLRTTSGALDGYDKEDVAGLLEDRLQKAREDWRSPRGGQGTVPACTGTEGYTSLPALFLCY